MYILTFKATSSAIFEKEFNSFRSMNNYIIDNKISNFKFKKLNK